MGRKLNWFDALLDIARRNVALHQYQQAHDMLQSAASSTCFGEAKADEARLLFAECCLQLSKFKEARSVLRRLIAEAPRNPQPHHWMARAIDRDPSVDAGRAGRYYRRALELDSDNIEILKDAGEYHISMGEVELGLGQLRSALRRVPGDFSVLQSLVEALCDSEQFDAARETLAGARFRHGRSAAFEQLQSDCEFQALRWRQECEKPTSETCVVLPFLRVSGAGKKTRAQWRKDSRSRPKPHFPRVLKWSNSRHAP